VQEEESMATGGCLCGAIRFEGLALGGYVLRVVDSDWVGDDVPITLTDAAGFGQAGVLVSRKP